MSTTHPDDDERLLGALAHASIVANVVSLAGMVTATLLWATQRERSRFVRDHALQALAFQGAVLLAMVLMLAVWAGCLALSLLPAALRPDLYVEGGPPAPFWVVLAALVIPLATAAAATCYGLYGAYRVYRGQPFRYPLVGRVVRREPAVPAEPAPVAAPPPLVMPPSAQPQASVPPEVAAAPPDNAPAPPKVVPSSARAEDDGDSRGE